MHTRSELLDQIDGSAQRLTTYLGLAENLLGALDSLRGTATALPETGGLPEQLRRESADLFDKIARLFDLHQVASAAGSPSEN